MQIVTNNKPRPVVYGFELSEKEREEFDYYDPEELDNATFVRYKGQVYDLGEFMRMGFGWELAKNGWHGYASGSYLSGVLVRYTDDSCEYVVMGRYYA